MDRVEQAAQTRFDNGVESVRLGYIYARDNKQYRKWRSDSASKAGRKPDGLTGASLEAHIASLRTSRPDLVGVRA